MPKSLGVLRVLLVSTPVGPIGSGIGGGVELTIANIARELHRRGHDVAVIAPAGSRISDCELIAVPGEPQVYAQYQGRDTPIVLPGDSVLAAMWDTAQAIQDRFDVILNFAYDWLPLYLTPFFRRPVLHLLSMSSLSDAMDGIITSIGERLPGSLAVHTRAQADTFPQGERLRVIGTGMDLRCYPFQPAAEDRLCWVGRIAPEKGLEDAVAAADATGTPLDICGVMQDQQYWHGIREQYPSAPLTYLGFLSTADMAAAIGRCKALLMTPKWTEALGNVAIEALACGTPVIAYERGGPGEIVDHSVTGFLVPPDDVAALAGAIRALSAIDREECRRQAEQRFSLEALGDRLELWFERARAMTPAKARAQDVAYRPWS